MREMPFSFKALSVHPLFNNNDYYFMAIKDPDLKGFTGLTTNSLPTIGLVPKFPKDFKEGTVEQNNVDGNLPLHEIIDHLATLTKKKTGVKVIN